MVFALRSNNRIGKWHLDYLPSPSEIKHDQLNSFRNLFFSQRSCDISWRALTQIGPKNSPQRSRYIAT